MEVSRVARRATHPRAALLALLALLAFLVPSLAAAQAGVTVFENVSIVPMDTE